MAKPSKLSFEVTTEDLEDVIVQLKKEIVSLKTDIKELNATLKKSGKQVDSSLAGERTRFEIQADYNQQAQPNPARAIRAYQPAQVQSYLQPMVSFPDSQPEQVENFYGIPPTRNGSSEG